MSFSLVSDSIETMKFKDYLSSLISKRKTNSSKSILPKSQRPSNLGQYEITTVDESSPSLINDRCSRTELLLARHAQLVNTIVRTRTSEKNSESSICQPRLSQILQGNSCRTYSSSSTMPHVNHHSMEDNPLWIKTRQRTKIRTNPWLKTTSVSSDYTDETLNHLKNDARQMSGLIHSESFPLTMLMGTVPSKTRNLHHSDSGHGFSLSSSRMIDSSSPDDVSIKDDTYHLSLSNGMRRSSEGIISFHGISLNNDNFVLPSKTSRYQRSSKARRSSTEHIRSSRRGYHEQYSINFDDIAEDRSYSPQQTNPFILPLDTNSGNLSPIETPTNSRTILQHMEEIEKEIRLIQNLDFESNDQVNDQRHSIHQQVDQWVDACLTDPKIGRPSQLLPAKNCEQDKSSSNKNVEIMTAFYLTSMPSEKLSPSQNSKPIRECPF